jgi:hypothetical protein
MAPSTSQRWYCGKARHEAYSPPKPEAAGVAAAEGRLLFMTTNHPERLDPALVRWLWPMPGRKVLRFHPNLPQLAHGCTLVGTATPMAILQEFLLVHQSDPWAISRDFLADDR